MWATLGDLKQIIGTRQFWGATIKLTFLIAIGLTILLFAFTTLLVLLPIALIGGLALHLYIRRKLRQARRRQPSDSVIDAEYIVIDKR